MREFSNLEVFLRLFGGLLALGWLVAVVLFGTITAAWSVRPRDIRSGTLGIHVAADGTVHLLPGGEGHVEAVDCFCDPKWVTPWLPTEPPWVEHRPLPTMQR